MEVAADLSRQLARPVAVDPAIANQTFRGTLDMRRIVNDPAQLGPLLGVRDAPVYVAQQLAYATGIIQGALRRLGVAASVPHVMSCCSRRLPRSSGRGDATAPT